VVQATAHPGGDEANLSTRENVKNNERNTEHKILRLKRKKRKNTVAKTDSKDFHLSQDGQRPSM